MPDSNCIYIGGRVYHRNPEVDRFQIDFKDLGELQMADIPAHSHLEVLGIQMPKSEFECEMWVVNGGDESSDEYLSVYGGASTAVTSETSSYALARLKRAFSDTHPLGNKQNPEFSVENFADRGLVAHAFLNLNLKGHGETTVRTAIEPFVSGFHRLCMPDICMFICHASEDKPIVRRFAEFIQYHGVAVWLDEREIKVGESIIEKVSEGIESATHLIIFLSANSVTKPWVTKELSSALMRQLGQRSISILPLRIDESPLPILLSDIKYADCRVNIEKGFRDLLDAVLL